MPDKLSSFLCDESDMSSMIHDSVGLLNDLDSYSVTSLSPPINNAINEAESRADAQRLQSGVSNSLSWREPREAHTPDAFEELQMPALDTPSVELDQLRSFTGRDSQDGQRWRPDSCPELSLGFGNLRTITPADDILEADTMHSMAVNNSRHSAVNPEADGLLYYTPFDLAGSDQSIGASKALLM